MSVIVFCLVSICLVWLLGYAQGKGHGLTEGRAIEMLKRAGFERPMRRRN